MTVTDVRYAPAGSTSFAVACPSGAAPEKVTVRVSRAADTTVAVSGEAVLRDPTARAAS